MTDKKLDELVANGSIKYYLYNAVGEDGVINKESEFRNTEQLTLIFNNGEQLTINSFCSGSLENTTLSFES